MMTIFLVIHTSFVVGAADAADSCEFPGLCSCEAANAPPPSPQEFRLLTAGAAAIRPRPGRPPHRSRALRVLILVHQLRVRERDDLLLRTTFRLSDRLLDESLHRLDRILPAARLGFGDAAGGFFRVAVLQQMFGGTHEFL